MKHEYEIGRATGDIPPEITFQQWLLTQHRTQLGNLDGISNEAPPEPPSRHPSAQGDPNADVKFNKVVEDRTTMGKRLMDDCLDRGGDPHDCMKKVNSQLDAADKQRLHIKQ
jgi:hypothetical protein